jgi:hypothetical protein
VEDDGEVIVAERGRLAHGRRHDGPPEGRPLEARESQLRSHLEAVASGGATHGGRRNVAFVVAHSTAGVHPAGYEAVFAAEGTWQLERLVERLDLAVFAD